MTGFTDRVSQGILNHITGKAALFTMPTAYIALFTAPGNDGGGGFTEVSGGGYARRSTAAPDWGAASGTTPCSISNAAALVFTTATADWGIITAFGLYDALTGGNLLCWDFFGNYFWLPATVAIGSPAVITAPNHGLIAGNTVEWTVEHGGASPTFSTSNFTGVLTVVSPTTDTFTVTNAGTGVSTSTSGSGMIRRLLPQAIINGAAATFPIGTFNIISS